MLHAQYSWVLFAALAAFMPPAVADDSTPPPQSRHQMMKDCMAKQKASDGGMPKEQMKQNCKDVTKPENENAKADKAATDAASGNKDAVSPSN
jgi:predicted Rdx family selenoprotein